MQSLKTLQSDTRELRNINSPLLLRLNSSADQEKLNDLIENKKISFVHDEIYGQLQELVKIQNPTRKLKPDDYEELIKAHIGSIDPHEYGVWVYYPWNQKLVHLLDEEEFIEVRTNRNRYKLTGEEQATLRTKKIGIVGLSVGHSIALTLAMERVCGELRLADFDTAELSNLNRIRTSSFNLGLNKTVIAAREILEIDPFIKIVTYDDGLHPGNMDDFFQKNGKLDLFVEVCDGLDVKILSRFKARELELPVVMDTNDRGMLDVERFDLQPQRPILHGLADGLDPKTIKDLTNEQKIPYILKMIGAETISTRLKASMLEVEQSINTWPQSASSVTLGGALTTDVCRRILLDQYHDSGRYYIDLEDLVKDESITAPEVAPGLSNPYQPLQQADIDRIVNVFFAQHQQAKYLPNESEINQIIDAAIAAPSAGNNQPWKFVFCQGVLLLLHDKHKSWSWGDYHEMGSHMALGAVLENIHLQAGAIGLDDDTIVFPVKGESFLIAAIRFSKLSQSNTAQESHLAEHLFTRNTNRKVDAREILPPVFFDRFRSALNEFADVQVYYADKEKDIIELAEIIAECDKVRLLNKLGHEEFYHEIRWNKEQAEKLRDGVEIDAVDISQSEIAGFKVAQDWKAVELLAKWNKGTAFKKLSLKSVKAASAIIVFTIPEFSNELLIEAGKAVQKAWLLANGEGVAVHPMLSPAFFFNRLVHGKGQDIPQQVAEDLYNLRERFLKVVPIKNNEHEVFIMKVAKAAPMGTKSLRKDKSELFIHIK